MKIINNLIDKLTGPDLYDRNSVDLDKLLDKLNLRDESARQETLEYLKCNPICIDDLYFAVQKWEQDNKKDDVKFSIFDNIWGIIVFILVTILFVFDFLIESFKGFFEEIKQSI